MTTPTLPSLSTNTHLALALCVNHGAVGSDAAQAARLAPRQHLAEPLAGHACGWRRRGHACDAAGVGDMHSETQPLCDGASCTASRRNTNPGQPADQAHAPALRRASWQQTARAPVMSPSHAPLCLAGCCCLAGAAGRSSAAIPGRFKAIMRCNRGACATRASGLQRPDEPQAAWSHARKGRAGAGRYKYTRGIHMRD